MAGMHTALLDNIRISNGPDSLRSYFHELLHTDREKLIKLLNDRDLRFCSLYVLKQDIASSSLFGKLPPLYQRALEITDELSKNITRGSMPWTQGRTAPRASVRIPCRFFPGARGIKTVSAGQALRRRLSADEKRMRSQMTEISPALEWMVKTGWDSDMNRAEYELFMERCTALLLKSFRNSSVLPAVADTIFERNRKGKLIHNLVWAFFEARDPDSLYLIVQRLNSGDDADTALAKKLLCFIPELDEASGAGAYFKAMQWLSENRPFLFYTEETMQMCTRPVFYAVSQEARYLCRPVSADSGKPLSPLRDNELELLRGFRELPGSVQKQLADFSLMLNRRNIHQWDSWIRQPVARQAETISEIMGGSV
jgi:hypothetical protein